MKSTEATVSEVFRVAPEKGKSTKLHQQNSGLRVVFAGLEQPQRQAGKERWGWKGG